MVDIPKDIQFASGIYKAPQISVSLSSCLQSKENLKDIEYAVSFLAEEKRLIICSDGGVISLRSKAVRLLRGLVQLGDFPITSILMGLGVYPASSKTGWECLECMKSMKLI